MTARTTKDPFEFATKNKLRFPSSKNELTVEQLWDVPLRSRDDFNLNDVAKRLNRAVKHVQDDENFVSTDKKKKNDPAQLRAKIAFDIVLYIIEFREAEETKRESNAKRKAERETLYAALEKKQGAAIDGMSEAAIKKKLAALDDEDDEG